MAPWISLLATAALASAVHVQPGFSDNDIARVRHNLIQSATKSWELGAAAQALTELSWPSLSVFNRSAFPPPSSLSPSLNATDVLTIANSTVFTRPSGSLALIAGQGSAADPASIGVAVLLANWTHHGSSGQTYSKAATDQLTYLLEQTPRSESGAISHRADEVQLWSDFVYMVPPFIAYYGALQGGEIGRRLLQTAYDQCRLYRDALRDESGLWKHVVLGSWQDKTHWATGNAWAAAGMLRVHQTLNHSSVARNFTSQQTNLTQWIDEILEESWSYQTTDGAVRNVIDNSTSFVDTAATSLLAAVTYRTAVIQNTTVHIPAADKALGFIQKNVDPQGWLQNAVNPYTFNEQLKEGEHTPEGQAFVLLLHAAWKAFADSTLANHTRSN